MKVFATAMENDSTALKPAIQYDENQQINVGLKDRADIRFVNLNPNPKPEFLKENVVTEANVTYQAGPFILHGEFSGAKSVVYFEAKWGDS